MKKLVSYGSISFALAMLFAMTASAALAPNPPVVDLGTAGNFVILSTAGITDVSPSAITGNIGTSPITGASITATDGNICDEVVGAIFTIGGGPSCEVIAIPLLSTAVGDMGTAYTDAVGRAPSSINVGGGTLAGLTLTRGVYQWSTPVTITGDLTLNGGANDVWIFQLAQTLDMEAGMSVILTGGAQAKNVFWQVAGAVTLLPGSSFEGTILAQTNIAMQTDATLNGRALAQTAVTLEMNTVTIPAFVPAKGQKPIKFGPIHDVVQGDIGSCNNVWATDTFDKKYTITPDNYGSYNVTVDYTGGKFVTLAGKSPGACESGVNNGYTVAAGIKGDMQQEYNGTVIGTLSGAKCTKDTCVSTDSILATLFNPGFSWVILPDGGHWTWSNTYKAGKHGTWLDTSTNWPLNDTGDIQ